MQKKDEVQCAGGALAYCASLQTSGYKLKEGDYTIRVHVIECRELKALGNASFVDSVVKVDVLGKTQHTRIVKGTLTPSYDEVLFYEFRNLYPVSSRDARR